jgi:hypothetical protein
MHMVAAPLAIVVPAAAVEAAGVGIRTSGGDRQEQQEKQGNEPTHSQVPPGDGCDGGLTLGAERRACQGGRQRAGVSEPARSRVSAARRIAAAPPRP